MPDDSILGYDPDNETPTDPNGKPPVTPDGGQPSPLPKEWTDSNGDKHLFFSPDGGRTWRYGHNLSSNLRASRAEADKVAAQQATNKTTTRGQNLRQQETQATNELGYSRLLEEGRHNQADEALNRRKQRFAEDEADLKQRIEQAKIAFQQHELEVRHHIEEGNWTQAALSRRAQMHIAEQQRQFQLQRLQLEKDKHSLAQQELYAKILSNPGTVYLMKLLGNPMGIPGLAQGGSVGPGQPFMVGERGPEVGYTSPTSGKTTVWPLTPPTGETPDQSPRVPYGENRSELDLGGVPYERPPLLTPNQYTGYGIGTPGASYATTKPSWIQQFLLNSQGERIPGRSLGSGQPSTGSGYPAGPQLDPEIAAGGEFAGGQFSGRAVSTESAEGKSQLKAANSRGTPLSATDLARQMFGDQVLGGLPPEYRDYLLNYLRNTRNVGDRGLAVPLGTPPVLSLEAMRTLRPEQLLLIERINAAAGQNPNVQWLAESLRPHEQHQTHFVGG